jgi:glucoamylase
LAGSQALTFYTLSEGSLTLAESSDRLAPGWPGIPPRWTSSAKSGIGTALNPHSRVWYTISHGILNEVYFPRVDQACTRDLGFIITDGYSYFSEEKRQCDFQNVAYEPGVPVFQLTNSSRDGRYRIHKDALSLCGESLLTIVAMRC